LGAALEVQAQVLAARGQQAQAALLLKHAIATLRHDVDSRAASEEFELNWVWLGNQLRC